MLDAVERWPVLDGVAGWLISVVRPVTRRRQLGNLLTGVSFGHPVHPALAQMSLGFFASAGLLDIRARQSECSAARTLVAAGLASAVPTAVTGLADLSHGHEQQQRVGMLHAVANATGLLLFAGSLLDGKRGAAGRMAGLAGLGTLGAAAYLGGHLAFRQALGANHAEHVPHRLPSGWTTLCQVDEVPERGLAQRLVGDQPLAVFRMAGDIRVLSDVCPHLAGPLHEGELRDGCVVCPWHGSAFRAADGSVHTGPATAPVPAFDVRVSDGSVLVRLPGAG
jgi:nitrite reductase/ring-hydroxylating ferredoxin subunit